MNILNHDKSCSWNNLKWKSIHSRVFKWQRKIYIASKENNIVKVRNLQNLILKSRDAKLVAVRQVRQDNKVRKMAGVDSIKSLNLKFSTKSNPVGKVLIPKPGIPTIKDRCLQALFKLALEAEWEAKFETNLYGFRPGRNAHDAIVAIQSCIQKRSKFVLDANISNCFDKRNHHALLNLIGLKGKYRKQLQHWLEADQQGGVLSPLLTNIAFHGLENHLKHCIKEIPVYYSFSKKVRPWKAHERLHVIRYANDFLIFHENLNVIIHCKNETRKFLSKRGLELSEVKTRITHTLEINDIQSKLIKFDGKIGFNFLGLTIKQYKLNHKSANKNKQKFYYKSLIYPSKDSINKHQKEFHNIILKKGKKFHQDRLIDILNPFIVQWARYFGLSNRMTTSHLNKQDYLVSLKLRKWSSKIKKTSNYWDKSNKKLAKHIDYSIPRYIKVKTDLSPFDQNKEYWSNLIKNQGRIHNVILKKR